MVSLLSPTAFERQTTVTADFSCTRSRSDSLLRLQRQRRGASDANSDSETSPGTDDLADAPHARPSRLSAKEDWERLPDGRRLIRPASLALKDSLFGAEDIVA